ncbi:hypothetical protein Q8A67_014586 [Cirrhinus molitorella]|uniref:Claudin 34 n=1 Tax=Cirrhinus molitorella TaxID=172907 RepID=A0AA88TL44_9TELE|nr:hypothetical protein Q8A67_014586 [Cirrhinus molitorella]
MVYLSQSVHLQFAGLVLGFVGWLITASISGVNDWRIWYVDNQTVVTGGLAWVGVWRVCFNSHILDSAEICKSISLTDSFTPPEIAAAQVLCMVAIGVGVVANLLAGHAVRNGIFEVDSGHVRLTFVIAGSLYWLTAACSLVPVFWNMNSVLANLTIDFPPDFYLPSAPVKQEVGAGIGIGIGSGCLLIDGTVPVAVFGWKGASSLLLTWSNQSNDGEEEEALFGIPQRTHCSLEPSLITA